MRVLCSTTPMQGVFGPLLPLATALREQGHTVLVATAPDLVERVREAGLVAEVAGPPAALAARRALSDPAFAEGTQPWRIGAVMFARVMAPEKVHPLRELAERFAPDLVLHPSVDPLPPSLRPAAPLPTPEVRPIRPYLPGGARDPLPSWAGLLGRRPVVYVSLGTVPIFNRPEMFTPVLDGLAGLDVEVVVTVGHDNDPAALGERPCTVHVERWLSLAALLPRCAAVVCHAGAGTTLAALATGLPLVLLPRGADQFPTASAVHRAGAGLVITPARLTPSAVGAAAHAVLTDPSYRRAATGLRAEIQAMPAAEDVAAELAAASLSQA